MGFSIRLFGLVYVTVRLFDIDFSDGDVGLSLVISWKGPTG